MASIAAIDGVHLIVARGLAAAVVVIVLKHDLFGFGVEALPGAIARPQIGGRRKGVEAEVRFDRGAPAGAVVEHEAVAVRGKHEGNIQRRGIVEALLDAVADAVIVVLGLDQRDRDVRLVVENEVGLLRLAARDQLAAHDDPALGEIDLLANLQHLVPAGALDGGQDELRADIAFGEAPFIHRPAQIPHFPQLERYAVLESEQRIGRIRLASERMPSVWLWSVSVHLPGGWAPLSPYF